MNEQDFCFWLHGWDELNGGDRPSKEQWEIIKEHLKLASTPEPFHPIWINSKPITLNTPIVGYNVPLFNSGEPSPTLQEGYDPKLLGQTINITC